MKTKMKYLNLRKFPYLHAHHLHRLNRVAKPILDLLRQEIFAVLAVAVVCLIIVVSYTFKTGPGALFSPRSTNPSTGGNSSGIGSWLPGWSGSGIATNLSPSAWLSENPLQATTALGDTLFNDDATIYFGPAIKGYDREGVETWTIDTGVQNRGGYLLITRDTQVTIAGITNGNHTLWVTGKGAMTINGTAFTFKTLSTLRKVVGVINETMVIKFQAGAQIFAISTLSPDTDIPAEAEAASLPAKILMIPNKSTVTLNNKGVAMLKPIVIITDPDGKQITNTAGLLNWTSSNAEVATVSNAGIVTAAKTGTATITANITNTDLSASIYLTVKAMELSPLIDVTPPAGQ